jgi:hypothetical protein
MSTFDSPSIELRFSDYQRSFERNAPAESREPIA